MKVRVAEARSLEKASEDLRFLSGFYMLHRSLLVLLYFSNLHFKYFFMDLGIRLPDESRKNVPFHINASSKDIKP